MRKISLFAILILSLAFSNTQPSANLEQALQQFCEFMFNIVGDVAVLMILLSSVVYTGGQMFGAETRARANVWATNMLTGAIIGILIITIMPWFLAQLVGITYGGECNFSP